MNEKLHQVLLLLSGPVCWIWQDRIGMIKSIIHQKNLNMLLKKKEPTSNTTGPCLLNLWYEKQLLKTLNWAMIIDMHSNTDVGIEGPVGTLLNQPRTPPTLLTIHLEKLMAARTTDKQSSKPPFFKLDGTNQPHFTLIVRRVWPIRHRKKKAKNNNNNNENNKTATLYCFIDNSLSAVQHACHILQ